MALLINFPRASVNLLSFECHGHDALLQHIARCQHERHEIQRRNAATYSDERALALSSAARAGKRSSKRQGIAAATGTSAATVAAAAAAAAATTATAASCYQLPAVDLLLLALLRCCCCQLLLLLPAKTIATAPASTAPY